TCPENSRSMECVLLSWWCAAQSTRANGWRPSPDPPPEHEAERAEHHPRDKRRREFAVFFVVPGQPRPEQQREREDANDQAHLGTFLGHEPGDRWHLARFEVPLHRIS